MNDTRAPEAPLDVRVRGLKPSATIAIHERAHRLAREGRTVFKLGLGQSPFPVPEPVVDALRRNAHQRDYLPTVGLAALREAVAAHHARIDGVPCQPDQVMIGPGSKELMFLLQLACDAELLLPGPSWVSYAPQARVVGRPVRVLPTRREDGWRLQPDDLAAHCAGAPARPRLLVLNYPSNPTGLTYPPDELEALAEVARRYGVVVLSDEIYGRLHHRGAHASIAPHHPEGTVLSSGLSKWCGAGGWRLGVFIVPREMAWLRDAMVALASETCTSTSAPIQYAAITAYEGGPRLDACLDGSRRLLAALGRWTAARLRGAGAHVHDPEGGFYLFPDLSPHADALRRRGVYTSADLCEALLQDTGVAILPGSDFARPPRELTARLAYVDFDGGAALEALEALPPGAAVDEAFLRAWCPRTVEAVERLCGWLTA